MFFTALFYEVGGVDSITIPDTAESIGSNSFALMSDLKQVTIPKKIKMINEDAFSNCMRLSNVKFHFPGSLAFIGRNAFAKTNLSNMIIPSSVKVIGSGAFYWCSNLKKVIFMDGVETVGQMMFVECRELSYVSLPRTLKEIGMYAFQACKKLDKLYYSGTKNEFEMAMQKFSRNWAYQSALDKVICYDGVIDLDDRLKITV